MKKIVFALALIVVLFTTFSPALATPVRASHADTKVVRIPFKIICQITRFKEKSVVVYVMSSLKGADAYVGRTVTLAVTGDTIITIYYNTKKKYATFSSLKTSDILTVRGNIRENGLFVATDIKVDRRTK